MSRLKSLLSTECAIIFLMHIIKYSAPVSTGRRRRRGGGGKGLAILRLRGKEERTNVLRNVWASGEARDDGFERRISSAEFMRSIDRPEIAPRYSVLILLKFLLLPGRESFLEKEILNNLWPWI